MFSGRWQNACREVFDSQTAQDGPVIFDDVAARVLEPVAAFDEQPLTARAIATRPHQSPAALQLASVEEDGQPPTLETLPSTPLSLGPVAEVREWLAVLNNGVGPRVPHDDF